MEDLVNSMEDSVVHLLVDTLGALSKPDKVVDIYIHVLDRFMAQVFDGWHCWHSIIFCQVVGDCAFGIGCLCSAWGVGNPS